MWELTCMFLLLQSPLRFNILAGGVDLVSGYGDV